MEWLKNAFIVNTKEYFLTWIIVGILAIIAGIVVPNGLVHYFFVFVFYTCLIAVGYPFMKAIWKQLLVLFGKDKE